MSGVTGLQTESGVGRLSASELRAQERAARRAERVRRRRVARDEAAERKRSARSGFSNPDNPRRSWPLTVVVAVFAVYCLFPFVYLLVNATKTQADFTSTFGLGFGHTFALWDNLREVFAYQDGIFGRWLLNTLLYVVVGAGGATLLAIMGGYALAKFRFPGRKAVFAVVIGAISVPGIALAVPQFLLFAKLGLTNTPWAMILPSLISPFGLYLMWIFSEQAVPTELMEAARVDGAGEMRTFFTIALPLLAPGIVTTALFTIVATWNNYFLPLIMLKDADWYPLTIGLNQWKDQASTAGGQAIQNLVITGSLVTIVPLVIAFLLLQKYWQSGLAAGAVKE
ncbi:carbohydrate ABC transporter permease [Bifidobacterium sp. ESL0764]|uniref:carbohydrate ABC transporter permease n=1 Tax=Bifidobacterium sp. ESL0764 TaxID=2983228 RepID=UPI0023F995CF|nr:carbohydrate ABC transporter permease [Bifidobacterium sp. ESL0764]WEV65299.1 carbohydrate ABC transporter permease [Bifidobacterium sp. ESL0764]